MSAVAHDLHLSAGAHTKLYCTAQPVNFVMVSHVCSRHALCHEERLNGDGRVTLAPKYEIEV